jgi:membrane protease YdiL (CAAX protease family)
MTANSADWGLVLLLTIGLQGLIMLLDRRKPPITERSEQQQLRHYHQTYILFIVALVLIFGTWLNFSRPMAALGFTWGTGWKAIAGWSFALAACTVLVINVIGVRNSAQWREKAAADIARTKGMEDVLPRSQAEYLRFLGLCVIGGTAEEVIYRGYLIWVLSAATDPWMAGAVSLLFFVIAHTYYRGRTALLKVAVAGAVLTVLYLVSGSLWPGIILHVALDVASTMVAWHAGPGKTRPTA